MKRVALALVAAVCLGRPEIASQVQKKAEPSPIQHQVTVTLKLIQVFVTDAAGKPALDLERSDFVVYDNGAPRTITDFERHILAAPAAVREAMEAAPVRPPESEPASLLSRKFIFLIDYVRNDLEGVQKAKKAALEFLDSKVGPEDEVALFTLSPMTGLTLHEYLTKDHAKVRAKLKKLREHLGAVDGQPGGELMGMELMNAQVFTPHGGHAGPNRRNLFEEIAAWAKALRSIPGQKNIILFTMGFGNGVVRPGSLDNMLFETMARALASANAPVFTVDTTPQAVPGRAVDATLPSGTLSERSLAYLSGATGGAYLGGVNFSSKIADKIEDATSNYYVLGFTIPAAWDGKFHEIKVEVRRPGHKVYAQGGYFNPLPFAKLSPVEKHLHLLDLALAEKASSKRNLDFPLTAVPFSDKNEANTLLLSEIPVLSVRDVVGDRAEFIILIFDSDKKLAVGQKVDIDWRDFKADKIYQYATVALAPGRYDCRAVIRNLDDGRAAVGECIVEVPEPLASGPALFPPLFLVRGPESLYLNMTTKQKTGEAEDVSLSRIFPFPANEYVPLVGPLEHGRISLHAVVRCVGMGEREGELELSAWISAEGGKETSEVGLDLLNSFAREGTDAHLLEFDLPELLPGRYRLEIRAEDGTTGLTMRTAGWFSVRPPG